MDPFPEHNPKQAGQAEPATEEIEKWDADELLRWIQQKTPKLLRDKSLEKFKAAEIPGVVFLMKAGDVEFFENKCKLPIGPSEALAALSRKIAGKKQDTSSEHAADLNPRRELAGEEKKRNKQQAEDVGRFDTTGMRKQLGQVAGQKRKGDRELDPPTTLEKSLKRKRGSQEDQDNHDNSNDSQHGHKRIISSKSFLELSQTRKRLINERIKKLDVENSIDHTSCSDPPCSDFDLPGAVHSLSDPEYENFLPFPVIPPLLIPGRFECDEKNYWRFAGREKFRSLLKAVKKMRTNNYSLWVYGTRGYGKSHLLAALFCYLTATGERVVYIPDCRSWLSNPVEYLRAAMLIAWTDKYTQDLIYTLDTQPKILEFLQQSPVFFIIDQMNALSGDQAVKVELKIFINRIIFWGKAVFSSSANNLDYLQRQIEQNNEETFNVYGGFTEVEKEQWWKRHPNLDLGRYTRADIEDLTGNIPLLLNECLQSGTLDVHPLKYVAAEAVDFTRNIKATIRRGEWERYCYFMKACLLHRPISVPRFRGLRFIDRRFFFEEHGIGRYSCGVVRKAVANALTEYQEYFIDARFLNALPTFYNNPSTIGFFMEYAVLFYLQLHGIPIHDRLNGRLPVVSFDGSYPDIKMDAIGKAVLYHPQDFNYPILDGFLVYIKATADQENSTNKVVLYPYQVISRRKPYKDSHAEFFENYDKWIKGLQLEDCSVTVEFLWFTDEDDKFETNELQPASGGKILRCGRNVGENSEIPSHQCRVISFKELDKDLGERYEKAKQKANDGKRSRDAEKVAQRAQEAQEVEEVDEVARRTPQVNSTRSTVRSTSRIGTKSTAKVL